MKKVYVVSAKRTAIGSFMGTLGDLHPAIYGSEVVKTILNETGVPKDAVDEVVVGNILPAGLGQGVARQVAIHAGIPTSVPAYGVNMVCGSGMKTVMNAFTSIQAGLHNVVIAGGVESMSKAPYILPDKIRPGIKMGGFTVKDHMIDDALMDAFNPIHMGITAENIVEKYGLSREEQDQFAINSQTRAIKAVDAGRFKDEIVPITISTRKGDFVFETDEYPNRVTTYEKLSSLRPAFKKDGSVTAGNSSGINDGASFMLIVSEEALKKYNLTPLAEIVGIGQGGVDPNFMGLGPVPAIDAALKHSKLAFNDLELFELNEAFAAQSLGVLKDLETAYGVTIDEMIAKTNVNGGAIALGHPVGASGNRIIVTLLHEMIKSNKTYGLASLCIGGGMGTAIILKRSEQ
ncbi:acetyl-CoA C-acetyltransferase [Liberiplasma polymorphum]|uniref:acetyl-CoA C-acetyltransferase n=1 Tax=Liberiplasma polymorphum TaxID=3374570 RepID=UPI0037765C52